MANIFKVKTGSTGPQGKEIYDVFEDERKLELPEFQKRGLNIDLLKEGQAPSGFKSKFLPTTPTTPSVSTPVAPTKPSVPEGVSFDPKTGISTVTDPSKLKPTAQPDMTKEQFAAQQGVDPSLVRGLPGNFSVAGSPVADVDAEEEVISDTGEQKAAIKKTADDIKDGLASFETPPVDTTSPLVKEILDNFKARETELTETKKQEEEAIKSAFETAKGETQIRQEEDIATFKEILQTRLGGVVFQKDRQDLEKLQRDHRLELIGLEGKQQLALIEARKAYQSENFELAKSKLDLASKLESQTYQRKQNHFDNLLKLQALQTKLADADETTQEEVFKMVEKYPNAFKDVKNAVQISNMTVSEARYRAMSDPSFLAGDELKAETVGGFQVLRDATGKVISTRSADGGDTGVKITSTNKTKLLGAGFSSSEISQIESDVNTHGIDSVLEGIDDEKQKKAIQDVYGVKEKVTREKIEAIVTQKTAQDGLKDAFTEEQLIEFAKEGGFGSRKLWFDKSDEDKVNDYLNSNAARQKYVDLLEEQYRIAGILEE